MKVWIAAVCQWTPKRRRSQMGMYQACFCSILYLCISFYSSYILHWKFWKRYFTTMKWRTDDWMWAQVQLTMFGKLVNGTGGLCRNILCLLPVPWNMSMRSHPVTSGGRKHIHLKSIMLYWWSYAHFPVHILIFTEGITSFSENASMDLNMSFTIKSIRKKPTLPTEGLKERLKAFGTIPKRKKNHMLPDLIKRQKTDNTSSSQWN